MQNRLFVKEAILVLNYKKRTSFNRWCRLNNVGIYSDIGSNRHYVLKPEFEKALARNPIIHIPNLFNVRKYPDKFNSYMKLTSELRSYLDNKGDCKQTQEKYTPTQEHEKAMLVKWTEELGEL